MTKIVAIASLFALAACGGHVDHAGEHAAPAATTKAPAPKPAAPVDTAMDSTDMGATTATDTAMDSTDMGATTATDTAGMGGEVFDGEIGCGSCVYHMAGVTGCTVAAKIGDQTMLVQGGGIDAHSLCDAAKKAKLTGTINNGTLVASKIEITP